jgi:hypothetical protein
MPRNAAEKSESISLPSAATGCHPNRYELRQALYFARHSQIFIRHSLVND